MDRWIDLYTGKQTVEQAETGIYTDGWLDTKTISMHSSAMSSFLTNLVYPTTILNFSIHAAFDISHIRTPFAERPMSI